MNTGALLRLVRPPNVFTAFADALAGLLILRGLGVTAAPGAGRIIFASGCLYLAGIVLNDVFDREVDARERPTRPIPRGEISARFAALLGAGLMLAGVGLAASVGRSPAIVAAALAAAILAYDGGLKHTRVGPLVMGACRGLDVTMALSTGLALDGRWPPLAIAGPIVLALYITGLTYVARDEVDGKKGPGVYTYPAAVGADLVHQLGEFPLFDFWGPRAGIASSRWIADAARRGFDQRRPTLTMVYLPHLDYDHQRFGPDDVPRAQPDLRLVMQLELLVLDGNVQFALEGDHLPRFAIHGFLVVHRLPAPARLGAVHRGVGVLEQLLGRCLLYTSPSPRD